MVGLSLLNLESVELLASIIENFLGINTVSNSLLILPEEDVVLDFNIFGLGKAEAGDTEVVLELCYLVLVSIDFPDIVLDIMSGGRFLVQLTLGADGFKRFLFVEIRAVCFGWAPSGVPVIRVTSLGHNDNIIQINYLSSPFIHYILRTPSDTS